MRIRNIVIATVGALAVAGCAYDDYGYPYGYGDRYYSDRYRDDGGYYYRDNGGYYRDDRGYYRDRDNSYGDPRDYPPPNYPPPDYPRQQ